MGVEGEGLGHGDGKGWVSETRVLKTVVGWWIMNLSLIQRERDDDQF